MEMQVDFPGGARVDAHFGGFTVHTDQPAASGGDNSAPGPFELFLASLATCAGFFVLRFCKMRGIPPEGIRLRQVTEPDPETHRASKISIEIVLPPEFPKQYEAAVVKAAESCLVKKTLADPPPIEVRAI